MQPFTPWKLCLFPLFLPLTFADHSPSPDISLEPVDKSKWIDPQKKFDLPLNSKHQPTHSKQQQCDFNHNELILLRHLLRHFVAVVHTSAKSATTYDLTVHLTSLQVAELERLLDLSQVNQVRSAQIVEQWHAMMRSLHVQQEPTSLDTFERRVGVRLSVIIQGLMAITLPFVLIHYERQLGLSFTSIISHILKYFLLVSFLVSFPWTWYRLVQEKVAHQQSKILEHNQLHCKPLSTYQLLKRSVTSYLSMKPSPSPCENYYRAIEVHPFLDVPPTTAIAVTLTNFIIEPLKLLGGGLGEFFQNILAPLPFYMWPVMVVFVLLMLCFLIIVRSGYRIHLPWWLGKIEPGHVVVQHQHQPVMVMPSAPSPSPVEWVQEDRRGKVRHQREKRMKPMRSLGYVRTTHNHKHQSSPSSSRGHVSSSESRDQLATGEWGERPE